MPMMAGAKCSRKPPPLKVTVPARLGVFLCVGAYGWFADADDAVERRMPYAAPCAEVGGGGVVVVVD